jgi:hypothetical protein
MVAEVGLEPTRSCLRQILSLLCLPISPLGHPMIVPQYAEPVRPRSGRLPRSRRAGAGSSRKRVQGETERVSPCRAMSAQENGEATASPPHRCALFSENELVRLGPLRSPTNVGCSSCRHLRQFCGFGGGRLLFCDGRLQCGKDDASGLLDDFQALGQQRCVAVVKLDVVGTRRTRH